MTITPLAIVRRAGFAAGLSLVLGACTYMPTLPDDRVAAFERLDPNHGAPFDTALCVVNGNYLANDAMAPGARASVEKRAWAAIDRVLREKNLARRVLGSEGDGELRLLCEFLIEDDVHPTHRTFSMLTLYFFPLWKKVQLTMRVRIDLADRALPSFQHDAEILEYRSPLFLFALPFNGPKPAARLFDDAARALAVHLARVSVDKPAARTPVEPSDEA